MILVIDSTDRERLSINKEELYRMLNCEVRLLGIRLFKAALTAESSRQDLRKAAVLIFANKQDLKGAMTSAEISQQLNLTSVKDHPWHIQACCALTGEGFVQPRCAGLAHQCL